MTTGDKISAGFDVVAAPPLGNRWRLEQSSLRVRVQQDYFDARHFVLFVTCAIYAC